jgi:hypothetical protein
MNIQEQITKHFEAYHRPFEPMRGNPLQLPICSEIPDRMTKGELAKRVLPEDATFDYSLPQEWLNHFKGDLYYQMLCQCVTLYPKGSIFGMVVNLITGDVYPL